MTLINNLPTQIQNSAPQTGVRPAGSPPPPPAATQTPAATPPAGDQQQIQTQQGSSATHVELFADTGNTQDFERVKQQVSAELSRKGIDPQKAFGVGRELTKAAEKWDQRMSSQNMSYAAVKRAIEDAVGVPYQGGTQGGISAKNAGAAVLSKAPEFVKLDGVQRSDLDKLPAGAVVVFKPEQGHGHIGVQNGQGQDISDVTRTQGNLHRAADFEVWFPVATRE